MNDKLQKIKQNLKNIVKRAIKLVLPLVLIILLIISAAVYVVKKHDGTYEEGNWANPQYAAGQYTGNTSIDSDGKISTNMSAQELWDKLMEEGSRVDLYLDGPEELLKLMNAEIVTNYPDLRPNPDDPIDWNAINRNINSTDVQGIIKFKRAQNDGATTTMSYVDSDTFYNWIEIYCTTGDETARQNALTHFTIEKNMTIGSGATDNLQYNGSDIVTDISERIIAAAQITPWPGASLCQAWVRAVYANAGLGDVAYPKAVDAYRANVVSTQMDNIPIGAAVYGTGTGAYGAGHVGIYIGNGQVMDSVSSGIRTQSLQEWVAWQENYGFMVDGRTGWLGWGWQSGSPTKIISGGEEDNENEENDDNNDEEPSTVDMQLITDNGKVTFYNGDGSAMEGGKLNAIGYELSDGQVAMKDLQQYKNCVIYIETAESGEGSYANGKFFYVTDTGGGLSNNQVDVYANVDQSTLNAAPYGSYTSGAKIYLVESNVTLEDYNSKYLDKELGQVNTGTTQNQNAYSVVVATWNKTQVIVETNDSQVEASNNTTLSMTTQKINYQDFVSGYTMPFDYLWDLLVHSEDQDFVLDLADLVYASQIEITIHDNLNVHTKKEKYNYTRKEKVQTINVEGSVHYQEITESGEVTGSVQTKNFSKTNGFVAKEYPTPCSTTRTTIRTTNTLDISLTKADVWIVKYVKEYEYKGTQIGEEQSGGQNTLENVDYGNPEQIQEDRNGDGAATLESERNTLISQGNTIVSSWVNTTCNVWHGVFEITEEITNQTDTTKYISSPSDMQEKTDKNAAEPNFVTILLKGTNRKAKHHILGASEWLFDLLEGNDKTADTMVDITKYLLFKASGNSKYWDPDKPFDFSIYDPESFTNIDGNYGDWDGTGSQEDFIKAVAPYAVIDMQQHQIYASVTIAQAIIESGWGKDNIAVQYKNFFGMKGGGAGPNEYWSGEVVNLNASEGGVSGFRVYDSLKNSIYDHGRNFHVTSTYSAHGVLDCIPQNLGPKEQLRRIAISGYAVYQDGSISRPDGVRTYDVYLYEEFIEKYDLEKYDTMTPEDFEPIEGNSEIVEIAKTKLGCPYEWAATGPDKFDCSGLVKWTYEQIGISVPRSTYGYIPYLGTSKEISWSEAQPGDIVWRESHMGIYLGNDQYIHAPQTGDVVKISSGASGKFTNVFRITN